MSQPVRYRRPALDPKKRWYARISLAVGLTLFVGWAVAALSATVGATVVERGDLYLWDTGSAIYVADLGGYETKNCIISYSSTGYQRAVHTPRDGLRKVGLGDFALHGVKVGRAAPGTGVVRCDGVVNISSGPILWILPFAYTPIPPVLGLFLIVLYGYFTGRNPFKWVIPTPRNPFDRSVRANRSRNLFGRSP